MNIKTIEINGGEEEYQKEIEVFWNSLNEYYKKFINILNIEENKWKETKKEFEKENIESNKKIKDVFYFKPEKVKNQSPITFLNGDWGIGKSEFIHKLINKLAKNKKYLEESDFDRVAVIDLWNYVSSEKIADEVLEDTINLLFSKNSKIKKELVKSTNSSKENNFNLSLPFKLFKVLTGGLIDLNYTFSWKISKKQKKKNIELKEKIKDEITPTILIFENVERLEKNVFELIKLIQKISELPKLLIIIPICKEKVISYNAIQSRGEHWLNKYSTLGVEYQIKQNYKNYLESINIRKEYINNLNEILIGQEKNLRVIERFFNAPNFLEKTEEMFNISKYHGLFFVELHLLQQKEKDITNIKKTEEIFKEDKNKFETYLMEIRKIFFDKENLKNLFNNFHKHYNDNKYKKINKDRNFKTFFWFFDLKQDIKKWESTINFSNANEFPPSVIFKLNASYTLKDKFYNTFLFKNFLCSKNFTNFIKQNIFNLILHVNEIYHFLDCIQINFEFVTWENSIKMIDYFLKINNLNKEFYYDMLLLLKEIILIIKNNELNIGKTLENFLIKNPELEFWLDNIDNNLNENDIFKKIKSFFENKVT